MYNILLKRISKIAVLTNRVILLPVEKFITITAVCSLRKTITNMVHIMEISIEYLFYFYFNFFFIKIGIYFFTQKLAKHVMVNSSDFFF